ncbi:hypothetical protein PQ43W_49 [Ralstonia phage PQ43W]
MATERKSSNSVTVACKLPQGLVIAIPEMDIHIKLHGSMSPYAIANHGMTHGIPADVWDAIEKYHAEAAWLKNGAVFAHKKADSAADQAQDREGVRIGFEPIDPNKPNQFPGMARITPEGTADSGRG